MDQLSVRASSPLFDCRLIDIGGGRSRCERCGWSAAVPATARRTCNVQPGRDVHSLAAICLACDYLRPTKHGARCTHKQCGCHGPEVGVEPSVMHGVEFSPALVNLLSRRPACPDGRW